MSKKSPTVYELETYEGRKISDRKDLGGGYCGSVSLEMHIRQLNDTESWVQLAKDRWYKTYHLHCLQSVRHTIIVDGDEYVRQIKE